MNRRSFFASLAASVAACAAPAIFLPKLEPIRWKPVTVREMIWVPNPEYSRAPYQIEFMVNGDAFTSLRAWRIIPTYNPFPLTGHYPPRFKRINGTYENVAPFIRQVLL